jgi:hypothetical protein
MTALKRLFTSLDLALLCGIMGVAESTHAQVAADKEPKVVAAPKSMREAMDRLQTLLGSHTETSRHEWRIPFAMDKVFGSEFRGHHAELRASLPAWCRGCDDRELVGSSDSQQFGSIVGNGSPTRVQCDPWTGGDVNGSHMRPSYVIPT